MNALHPKKRLTSINQKQKITLTHFPRRVLSSHMQFATNNIESKQVVQYGNVLKRKPHLSKALPSASIASMASARKPPDRRTSLIFKRATRSSSMSTLDAVASFRPIHCPSSCPRVVPAVFAVTGKEDGPFSCCRPCPMRLACTREVLPRHAAKSRNATLLRRTEGSRLVGSTAVGPRGAIGKNFTAEECFGFGSRVR